MAEWLSKPSEDCIKMVHQSDKESTVQSQQDAILIFSKKYPSKISIFSLQYVHVTVFYIVSVCVQESAQLHDAAADCVCALLQCLEDNNNQQQLEMQVFTCVVSLEEGFHLSVAHEDQEKYVWLCVF